MFVQRTRNQRTTPFSHFNFSRHCCQLVFRMRTRANMFFELSNNLHFLFSTEIVHVLCKNHIRNCVEFMERDNDELMHLTHFQYEQILDIKEKILTKSIECTNARQYLEIANLTTAIVPTLFGELDELLDGGFRSRFVYEICGGSASGKSWFCRQLIVRFANTFRQHVLLIDTINCWANEDFRQLNAETNVDFVTIIYEEDLIELLLQLKRGLSEKIYRYRVLVIDSVAALYCRTDDGNSDRVATLSNLSKIASLMKFLANEFNLIVIYVNLRCQRYEYDVNDTDDQLENVRDSSYLLLGQQFMFVPNVRMQIERPTSTSSTIRLLKNCNRSLPKTPCRL